ncbi:3990_t:CDS:2 [Acaulospora colombiana]|uniref:3990_t:CDS:1 n=1 Tax=Acaulospora colombiana TaxID=27376 RepID=A0ACA9NHQ5_9GLOM|nr:3990_t:CDS:2 [Acaulospora colombiana]
MPYLDHQEYDWHLHKRAVADRFTPNETQRVTLIVGASYIVAIAILWHIPYLNLVLYPFKLLTVALHEGATRMSGGIPLITLPAGYLGSSFMGACMIACGFNTNASKIATLVMAAVFILALFWSRRNVLSWVLILSFAGIIIAFWFIKESIALRFLVLFIGVMSCMYDVTVAYNIGTDGFVKVERQHRDVKERKKSQWNRRMNDRIAVTTWTKSRPLAPVYWNSFLKTSTVESWEERGGFDDI